MDYLDAVLSSHFYEKTWVGIILVPPYSHSFFPWGEERPIWLVSLGNFWKTCALAGQVPQDAVSTPPHGEQPADELEAWGGIANLPEIVWSYCQSQSWYCHLTSWCISPLVQNMQGRDMIPLHPSLMDKWKKYSIWNPRPQFESLAVTLSTF